MNETSSIKRVKRKIKGSQNPLFETWLKEWKDEAKRNESEVHYVYGRALKSLKKYPFRLETGKECFILENFGAKLCMMLDKKLLEYNAKTQTSALSLSKAESPSQITQNSGRYESPSATHETTDPIPSSPNHLVGSTDNYSNSPETSENVIREKRHAGLSLSTINCAREGLLSNSKKGKNNSDNNEYIPAYRSGGYAILLTLHKNSKQMTKAELETESQKYCDSSFKKSASNSHYTAWSSMSTLVKKGLVEKAGRPAKFSLTKKGVEVAIRLNSINRKEPDEENNQCINEMQSTHSNSCQYPNFNLSVTFNSSLEVQGNKGDLINNPDVCKNQPSDMSSAAAYSVNNSESQEDNELKQGNEIVPVECCRSEDVFFLLPNEFDVVLFVDHKEIENKQNIQNDKIVKYFQRRRVNFEVKTLNVGDYLWVCRSRENNKELVLPYIVERKRLDDLASSVKDGRFHEQKFRLKNCGVENCIYLVEKYGSECTRLGLPLPTIQQAVSNTRVIDGFDVKITNSNDESLSYLSQMTNFLTRMFRDKTLMSCNKKDLPPFYMSDELISLMSFPEFNKDSGKMRKFTVRNMLIKHLLQLNGMSVERAKAIVKVYSTPKSLIEALKSPGGDSAVANIRCGILNRPVGCNLAKSLQQLYTLSKLN